MAAGAGTAASWSSTGARPRATRTCEAADLRRSCDAIVFWCGWSVEFEGAEFLDFEVNPLIKLRFKLNLLKYSRLFNFIRFVCIWCHASQLAVLEAGRIWLKIHRVNSAGISHASEVFWTLFGYFVNFLKQLLQK